MSTKETVELTLDTTKGVEQFLEYVQDVVFTASSYEADALEAALEDPTHMSAIDVLSNEFHDLYSVMRAEIAAAAASGGMSYEAAENMQAHYNELCRLRDELSLLPARVVQSKSVSLTPETFRRKTLRFQNQDTSGSIPIDIKKKRTRKRKRRNKSVDGMTTPVDTAARSRVLSQPARQTQSRLVEASPTTNRVVPEPKRPSVNLPSPGVMKPSADRSLQQLPLLSQVTDQRLIEKMSEHPRPKQLEFQIKAIIDRIESSQTDRLSAWLGEARSHTFTYIQQLQLQELYALAALPIVELRAELATEKIRPEALLHWVQVVTDIQAMYPGKPNQLVGEVVISALVTQELAA